MSDDRTAQEMRAESNEKAFEKPTPGADHDPDEPQPAPGTENAGESKTRHGEDVAKQEQEAGRESTGTDNTQAQRPTGTSTTRDAAGINPTGETVGNA